MRRARASETILVVDDDPDFRRLVSTVLEQAGYSALEAATGEEALEAAREEPPRLVVLDVHLPGLSGHEVCRALRDEFDGLPILFVSGERTESFDRVGGLIVGGDDYLIKPFAPDELLARVRSLIRRSALGARLTSEESEILRLLADGLDQAEIASRLAVSPKAVRTGIERIYQKVAV